MSDDSTEDVRRTLAARTRNLCSNPDCRALMRVSQVDLFKTSEVGVVVEIAGADPDNHGDNEIWLCQSCANFVRSDPTQYPEVLLRAWKTVAEHRARFPIAKTAFGARTPSPVPLKSKSQRKTQAILPWKGKVVTVSEDATGKSEKGPGPTLVYSQARVLDCTESHVTLSRTAAEQAWSISLEDVELRIDSTANQLELCVRCA